ncbi:MAG: methyltransferase domain-containing protein [Rhizobiaceae bacterium]|nr:methyltransferase domain-containing protein [Rhizobiaceae bacterium]
MNSQKDSKIHGIEKYHHFDDSHDSDVTGQLKSVYADWADAYDDDNDNKLGTVSQPTTVAMLTRHCGDSEAQIMDVGCGTGLVGLHLQRAGFKHYDGTDISAEMMAHAKTRGYRKLLDLNPGEQLAADESTYDAVLCVGVFTHGHLGPEGFDELIRIAKPGGLICFTVNEGVWDEAHFDEAIEAHAQNAVWRVLEQSKLDYMVNEGVQAWYITAQKLG